MVHREVEAFKEISIISSSEAYNRLATGEVAYAVHPECERVVLEEACLSYWMEPSPEKQEYVVPIYEFKGKCLDKEGKYLEDFVAWCEAT
ncbi:hypothetical protein ACFLXE_06510 [Chloroflexota bacterium]